jgi:hypothetical protein
VVAGAGPELVVIYECSVDSCWVVWMSRNSNGCEGEELQWGFRVGCICGGFVSFPIHLGCFCFVFGSALGGLGHGLLLVEDLSASFGFRVDVCSVGGVDVRSVGGIGVDVRNVGGIGEVGSVGWGSVKVDRVAWVVEDVRHGFVCGIDCIDVVRGFLMVDHVGWGSRSGSGSHIGTLVRCCCC